MESPNANNYSESSPYTQDVNWTYITSSEDVMYVQFTSCAYRIGPVNNIMKNWEAVKSIIKIWKRGLIKFA